jgi:RNA polymerase sigma-70 factor (ECF subfamily)
MRLDYRVKVIKKMNIILHPNEAEKVARQVNQAIRDRFYTFDLKTPQDIAHFWPTDEAQRPTPAMVKALLHDPVPVLLNPANKALYESLPVVLSFRATRHTPTSLYGQSLGNLYSDLSTPVPAYAKPEPSDKKKRRRRNGYAHVAIPVPTPDPIPAPAPTPDPAPTPLVIPTPGEIRSLTEIFAAVFAEMILPLPQKPLPRKKEPKPEETTDDSQSFSEAQLHSQMRTLRAFAVALSGNLTRADDLVAETVAKALAHADSFQKGTNLGAWLLTILKNHYLSQYRKRKREVEDPDDQIAAQVHVPAAQHDHMDFMDLQEALKKVPSEQKFALLAIANGHSYDEAAAMAGCPVGTIKSRVNRARVLLLRLLEDEVMTPPKKLPGNAVAWRASVGGLFRELRMAYFRKAGAAEGEDTLERFVEGMADSRVQRAYKKLEAGDDKPVPLWIVAAKAVVEKTNAAKDHPVLYRQLTHLLEPVAG